MVSAILVTPVMYDLLLSAFFITVSTHTLKYRKKNVKGIINQQHRSATSWIYDTGKFPPCCQWMTSTNVMVWRTQTLSWARHIFAKYALTLSTKNLKQRFRMLEKIIFCLFIKWNNGQCVVLKRQTTCSCTAFLKAIIIFVIQGRNNSNSNNLSHTHTNYAFCKLLHNK